MQKPALSLRRRFSPSKVLFEKVMTGTDADPEMAAAMMEILNLMFSSGLLSNRKRIWLDGDQDTIYVELLILTSLSMKSRLKTW